MQQNVNNANIIYGEDKFAKFGDKRAHMKYSATEYGHSDNVVWRQLDLFAADKTHLSSFVKTKEPVLV